MRLSQLLENHPFIYVAGSVIAVSAVVAGVILFLANHRINLVELRQELDLETVRQQNQSDLESIQRGLERLTSTNELQIGQLTRNHERRLASLEREIESLQATNENQIERLVEQHEAEVSDLELRLASINRRVGEIEDQFVVSEKLIARDQVNKFVPNSRYYEKDGFYALEVDSGADWIYEESTELNLFSQFTGIDFGDQYPELVETATLLPLHLWRGKEVHRVENDSEFASLFPFVFVQRMPHETWSTVMGLAFAFDEGVDPDTLALADPAEAGYQETIEGLENFYRGDATGFFLTAFLTLELLTASDPSIRTKLASVEKKGNVVYVELNDTLSDIVVDGVRHSEYFLTRELILISTPKELFVVKTLIPTSDNLSKDIDEWISEFLDSFAILRESL